PVAEQRPLAELRPQPVGGRGLVDARPHQRDRTMTREQPTRGVAHQQLFVREREVHYRGSPRIRVAMMLRWISLEPPAMVLAKLTKKARAHRPCSSPRSGSITAPYGPCNCIPNS